MVEQEVFTPYEGKILSKHAKYGMSSGQRHVNIKRHTIHTIGGQNIRSSFKMKGCLRLVINVNLLTVYQSISKDVINILKGSPTTKASNCIKNLPVKTKMALLSRKSIFLAILLHGQFIHYTQLNLHPNIHSFHCSAAC